MARDRLNHGQHAAGYLRASRTATNPAEPREARRAARERMKGHEVSYPNVREHAVFGAPRHFPRDTETSLFEHQRQLRMTDLVSPEERRAGQRRLDSERTQRASAQRREQTAGPRAAASAASTGAGLLPTGGAGGTVMWAIGVGLLLALVYLLVAGKGSAVLPGVVGSITGAVHAFVSPKADPIASLEKAFGATPIAAAAPAGSSAGLGLPPSPGAGGTGSLGHPESEPPGHGGSSAEKAYLRSLAKAAGWGANAVNAWEQVIERESGWSPTAQNKSTNAYGIGQLNPSTESTHGTPQHPAPGSTFATYQRAGAGGNWKEQLNAMALYIQHTYGDPIAALASEHTRGWY